MKNISLFSWHRWQCAGHSRWYLSISTIWTRSSRIRRRIWKHSGLQIHFRSQHYWILSEIVVLKMFLFRRFFVRDNSILMWQWPNIFLETHLQCSGDHMACWPSPAWEQWQASAGVASSVSPVSLASHTCHSSTGHRAELSWGKFLQLSFIVNKWTDCDHQPSEISMNYRVWGEYF